MEKTKEEIVAELYALRAGLSVISQQADEVKGCEEKIASAKKESERRKDNIQKYNEQKELIKSRQIPTFDDYNALYLKYYREEKDKQGILRYILGIWGIFMFVPGIIAGLLFAIFGVRFIFAAIGFAVAVAVIIVFVVLCRNSVKKKAKKRAEDEVSRVRGERERHKQNVYAAEEACRQAVALYEEAEKSAFMSGEENGRIISVKSNESQILTEALEKQYNWLLQPADWQNIDLIIFYLQTGRADSIKESLQLADRQRQNDAIVNEIRRAAVSISNEIRSNFIALGQVMVQCFNSLSEQIDLQGRQLLDSLGDISAQNEKLISSAKLQNALQAKANVTSEQLKSDLEFMQQRMGLRA